MKQLSYMEYIINKTIYNVIIMYTLPTSMKNFMKNYGTKNTSQLSTKSEPIPMKLSRNGYYLSFIFSLNL